ncbi:cytosol aminopeptidase-like [Ceratitis capitata]|uniref:cytosol aminopeptidase-like n=1 Tax=Ceratitis capitata TaxID=7213 RepID=UPI000C6C8571|nr:cytosol aminopeptidase-like [Ceratitis capitata]
MSALRITNWLTKSLLRFQNVKNLKQVSLTYYADDSRVTKGLVIGLYQKEGEKETKLTSSGEKFDDRVQGKVTELNKETNLSGKFGKGKVFSNIDQEFRSIAVVGVGREGAGFSELEMLDEGMVSSITLWSRRVKF